MMRVSKRALIELIYDYANESKPYIEKRDELLFLATDAEKIAIEEFVSWFEEEPK